MPFTRRSRGVTRSLLVDRDQLNMVPRAEVAQTTADIFDRIQNRPKAVQLVALAASFLLMSTASGLPAQDTFAATKNLMYDPRTATRLELRFDAMGYHLNTELFAQDTLAE